MVIEYLGERARRGPKVTFAIIKDARVQKPHHRADASRMSITCLNRGPRRPTTTSVALDDAQHSQLRYLRVVDAMSIDWTFAFGY